MTHPDGHHFDYRYDALGRFTGLRENDDSDVAAQSWRPAGERFILNRGGAASGRLHDDAGRLWYLVDDLPNGAGVNWTFARNPAGQIVRDTRSNDAYAWTGHYQVDRAYQTNGLNQYSQAGGAEFTYDLNGNLVATPGPNGQTITYTYDLENRLVAASTGVQMGYDPLGRLAWTTGSPNFTSFLYDGDDLVAEYDWGGNVTERYVHGPGADEPWLWYHGATVGHASLRLPFADAQGSIVAVSTYLGQPLGINRYDEYGIPAGTNIGRFQYTGQTWLPELGLYYYKARLYSPTLGRFMQTDPVGYEGGTNLYAYVANDPVNHVDPDGRTCLLAQNGRTYLCRVDKILRGGREIGRERLTRAEQRALRGFEQRYTRGVNALMAEDRRVTVGPTGGRTGTSFTTTSREIGMSLAGRQFVYLPDTTSGTAWMGSAGHPARGTVFTEVYRAGISSSSRDIAHEGLHRSRAEILGNRLAPILGSQPYSSEHQNPYNEAAGRLLGE